MKLRYVLLLDAGDQARQKKIDFSNPRGRKGSRDSEQGENEYHESCPNLRQLKNNATNLSRRALSNGVKFS